MNKKKRALALGLAATQLTALSAVVAPLTAFAGGGVGDIEVTIGEDAVNLSGIAWNEDVEIESVAVAGLLKARSEPETAVRKLTNAPDKQVLKFTPADNGATVPELTIDQDYIVECYYYGLKKDSEGNITHVCVTVSVRLTQNGANKVKFGTKSYAACKVDVPVEFTALPTLTLAVKEGTEIEAFEFSDYTESAFEGMDENDRNNALKAKKTDIPLLVKNACVLTKDEDNTDLTANIDDYIEFTLNYFGYDADENTVIVYTAMTSDQAEIFELSENDGLPNYMEFKVPVKFAVSANATIADTITKDADAAGDTQYTVTAKHGTEEIKDLTKAIEVKKDDTIELTIAAESGFKFEEGDDALKITAKLNGTDIAEANISTAGDTTTITVPELDAEAESNALVITIAGALEIDPVEITGFAYGYKDSKTEVEVPFGSKEADIIAAIQDAVEITSLTTKDGTITGAALTDDLKAKFDLSAEKDGTDYKVTIAVADGVKTHTVKEDSKTSATAVKIISVIDLAKPALTADDLKYAVETTGDTLTSAIQTQVQTALDALLAEEGDLEDYKDILELNAAAAVKNTDGTYKVEVTPAIKSGAASDYKLKSTAAFEYTVSVEKLRATPAFALKNAENKLVTLSGNKKSYANDAAIISEIEGELTNLIDGPTFTDGDEGALSLTKGTHYTVTVELDKAAKTATVTLAEKENDLVELTTKSIAIELDFEYTATEVGAPTATTGVGTELEIPENATQTSLETLLFGKITLPAGTTADDFEITYPTAATVVGTEEEKAVVTFKIKDSDNFAWASAASAEDGIVTVEVNIKKGEPVPELTPEFKGDDTTLYVADTELATLQTALDSSDWDVDFTDDEENPASLTKTTDYVLTVKSYDAATGKATVEVSLTAAGAAENVIADGAVITKTIDVLKLITAPGAQTISESYPFSTKAATVKADAEAKVKEALTAAGLAESDYTIFVADPAVGEAGSKTVAVTVTIKDTVFKTFGTNKTDANKEASVNVSYTIDAAVTGTITAAEVQFGSVAFEVDGTAATSAVEGTTVTVVATPDTGYKLFGVNVTTTGGAAVTATKVDDTHYTFVMPAGNVTVTPAFTSASTPSTPSRPSSGGSSRPSGGSSGGSSSSSVDITSTINAAAKGSTITVPSGKTNLSTSEINAASKNDVTIIVPVNSSYSWSVRPSALPTTNGLTLAVSEGSTISQTELAKIKGAEPVTNVMSFKTYAGNLGTAAKLTVTTPVKSTTSQTKFANLYKVADNGALEFVEVVKIDADGKAVLPMTDSGKFALLVSNESKMPGDFNNDCTLNVTDAVASIDKIMAEFPNYKGDVSKLDLNGDGALDVRDVVMMVNRIMNGK